MLGTDYILDCLIKERIDNIFMVPGGLVDPFLPALGRQDSIKPIVAAQEGGAAYMADGYARASGKFGVALCIGGPGLTNTVTPIAAAQTDGSPVLILSGEVATLIEGLGMFQDASCETLNDVDTLKYLTRFSTSINNPKNLHHLLRHAMLHMLTGAKGPVHLSIPKDTQVANIEASYQTIKKDLTQPRVLSLSAAEATLNHFVAPYILAAQVLNATLIWSSIPEAVQTKAIKEYGMYGYVELVVLSGFYQMFSAINQGFDISLAPGVKSPFAKDLKL